MNPASTLKKVYRQATDAEKYYWKAHLFTFGLLLPLAYLLRNQGHIQAAKALNQSYPQAAKVVISIWAIIFTGKMIYLYRNNEEIFYG